MLAVQPDADLECIAVMMEHSQDVKHLAWHPHEEVSLPLPLMRLRGNTPERRQGRSHLCCLSGSY